MILATKQGTDGMTQPYTQPYTNPTPATAAWFNSSRDEYPLGGGVAAAWDPNRNGNVEALDRPSGSTFLY